MSILTAPTPFVNFDSADTTPDPATAPEAAEPRPSVDFSYYPDLEEERDAREMFEDEGDEPTEADWDRWAEEAYAMDRVCSGPIL